MVKNEFLLFNDTIINKDEIVHIKKVKYTRGCLNLGIRLTTRSSEYHEEWFNDDQRKRDDRFKSLVTILC